MACCSILVIIIILHRNDITSCNKPQISAVESQVYAPQLVHKTKCFVHPRFHGCAMIWPAKIFILVRTRVCTIHILILWKQQIQVHVHYIVFWRCRYSNEAVTHSLQNNVHKPQLISPSPGVPDSSSCWTFSWRSGCVWEGKSVVHG